MKRAATTVLLFATAAMLGVGIGPARADLDTEIVKVGQDYATAYASPLIHAAGPNLNGNLYQTAHVPWGALTFGVGVKFMGTYIAAEDQNFRKVMTDVDLGAYDPTLAGQRGTVVMGGPTMFGDTSARGYVVGYYNGVEVFRQATIGGVANTRWVPMVSPEAYVGGFFGLKGIIRYMPSFNTDVGKAEYWGLGAQWNINGLFPALPVDVLVGYMGQDVKVGEFVDANMSSFHLGVSKGFTALTVYGGFALESSKMDVAYYYEDGDTNVAFAVDGRQESRFTVGLTLDILLKLNLEMGHGDLTTYSAGLMFGM